MTIKKREESMKRAKSVQVERDCLARILFTNMTLPRSKALVLLALSDSRLREEHHSIATILPDPPQGHIEVAEREMEVYLKVDGIE